MLLEEPYSELAPKIPSLSADCLGPGCQVMAGLLSTWTRPCVRRWSGNKGRPSEGKAGSCAPPSPLLVTVGPGRPGPDPTWVISAECEVGAGGWPCDHPSLPGVPSPQSPGS